MNISRILIWKSRLLDRNLGGHSSPCIIFAHVLCSKWVTLRELSWKGDKYAKVGLCHFSTCILPIHSITQKFAKFPLRRKPVKNCWIQLISAGFNDFQPCSFQRLMVDNEWNTRRVNSRRPVIRIDFRTWNLKYSSWENQFLINTFFLASYMHIETVNWSFLCRWWILWRWFSTGSYQIISIWYFIFINKLNY